MIRGQDFSDEIVWVFEVSDLLGSYGCLQFNRVLNIYYLEFFWACSEICFNFFK